MLHFAIRSDSRDQIDPDNEDLSYEERDDQFVVFVDLLRLNPDMYDTCDAYYTSPYNQWRRKL